MDTNWVLLWMVSLSCLVVMARGLRASHPGMRGWMGVALLVLGVAFVGYLLAPQQAGYLAGIAWAVLILLPGWGSVLCVRLVNQQRYGRARKLALWLRVLHPFDGWTWQPVILQAYQSAQRGELTRAVELFQQVVAGAPPTWRRQARVQLFRLQRDWAGLLSWCEAEVPEQDLRRDPHVLSSVIRALGETGQLGQMLSLFDRGSPSLAHPMLAMFRASAYLVCFAFCGRRAAVAQLLQSPLRSFGDSMKAFWLATADGAAGNETAARAALERLATDRDLILRDAAADRLARPPRPARDVLVAADEAMLDRLEAALALEARDGGRMGARGARPAATLALVGANVLMFLVEVAAGGSEDPETLYRLGAAYSEGFDPSSSWRLLASTFLHWGPLHLVMNMVGLLVIGPYVERALGRARYLAVYLAAGTVAALVVLLSTELDFLVGASGCIMGLVGATVAVLLRAWRNDSSRPAARRLVGMAFIVILQVAFDLTTPQVSFRAHVTGLVVGFLITAFMRHWPSLDRERSGRGSADVGKTA